MTDPTPPFSECDDVTDDSALVQGDVFEWLERKDDPWLQFGVIVTANCDILHQKHRGILSYVPVLAIEDYLRIFFFPSALQKGVKSIAEQLGRTLLADEVADAIRAYQAENLADFPEPLSDSVALRWALTLTPEGLADELQITDPGPRKKFVTLVEDFRSVEAAVTGGAYAAQWNALVRLRVRQGPTAEKARERIWSEIRASIKDLPGDRFFLGRLGSVPGDGWIAYLRLVREIQHDQVAIRQPDLRKKETVAKRVARLRSPYIYRLTQQLIDVFAAIGLPSEYEESRSSVVDALSVRASQVDVGLDTAR